VSKDRYPKEAYAFTLKWTFKPAKAWRKNQADARPGK
jgi:hypothetical protein